MSKKLKFNKTKCYVCQERDIKDKEIFCSIECAVYSGCYSVTKGWIKDVEEYKKDRESETNKMKDARILDSALNKACERIADSGQEYHEAKTKEDWKEYYIKQAEKENK